jgi:hypothetical protein
VPTLDYLRHLYADLLGWYRSADTKGQILLTVNGVLVTVLAGAGRARARMLLGRTTGASRS